LLQGQAVAPPINPAPLEHPQPLVTIRTSDLLRLFSRIQRTVRSAGFEIGRVDGARYAVDGRRPAAPAKDFDRILVWLEWNPHEPKQSVEMYLAYGRYAEIWTQEGRGTHRVVVDQAFEDQHLGDVRRTLLQLADST
jgi:hypothetical protein